MAPETPVVGKFVWYELMTPNADTSIEFYKNLIGWEITEQDMGPGGIYQMFCAGDNEVAGIRPLKKETGAPPHWLAYISVEDVKKRSEMVEQMGGRLLSELVDVPGVGQYAVFQDPQGAVIAMFKGEQEVSSEQPQPKIGEVCWNEVMTTDPEAAKGFYGELFGWSFSEMDMGPEATYYVAKRGEFQTAGIMKLPPNVPAPPHWLAYIFVADLDDATARVEGLGGKVHMPPTDIPNIGRFSVIEDPLGAVISLFGELA